MAKGVPSSDILNSPEDVAIMERPSLAATSIVAQFIGPYHDANVSTGWDARTSDAIPFFGLNSVATPALTPPNVATGSPPGVQMSVIMRAFEEQLTRIQNFLLGVP